VTVKALLDSNVIEMFMNKKIAARYGFKLYKLDRPVMVRNINEMNNSIRAIIY